MKKKFKRNSIALAIFLTSISLTFQSCEPDEIIDYLLQIVSQTGWLQDQEEMDNIPEDITPFDDGEGGGTMPTKISLEDKFPPIGDQGQYGTCVVWSVGYNLKTALNAIEKGWSTSDLAEPNNQTSPKDLWMAIPTSNKGSNCNGTNFEPAMDALIANGAESMSKVPYTGLGSCTGQGSGNNGNKLANYRKIASEKEGLTIDNFKGYLSAGRPISIGARLGDNFMNWTGASVISYDTYNNPGMQHAYHAMVLVGYDDDKQAFRVRNSWGPSWGDNGSIWVNYDFFCNNFCFAAFVAQNVNNISIGSGGIQGDLASGYDLLAYSAEDNEINGRRREFMYDVYNSGDKIITPSQRWSILYLLYNATNANDYKIILEDYYTDEAGYYDPARPDSIFGYYNNPESLLGGFWNYMSVKPGKKVGEEESGGAGYSISYTMPDNITGKYYLVVMADGYDVIKEANEDNNFYFITAANGKPLEFEKGIIKNAIATPTKSMKVPDRFANTETQTLVKPGNLNAYTPAEIRAMLLHDKKTGKLAMKCKAFRNGENQVTKIKK